MIWGKDQSDAAMQIDSELSASVTFEWMWPSGDEIHNTACCVKIGETSSQLSRARLTEVLNCDARVQAKCPKVFVRERDFHVLFGAERFTYLVKSL